MTKPCLVVLSGGLDSTVVAYKLKSESIELRAAYFDYGKPVSIREKGAAKLIALYLGIPLDIIDVKGLMVMELGYRPWERVKTDDADGAKGTDHLTQITEDAKKYLASVHAARKDWFKVSGFHTLISLATYLAQMSGFNRIAVGLTQEQIISCPNLSTYLKHWENAINELNPDAGTFEVFLPFYNVGKPEIIRLGASLQAPLEATWSCSNDQGEYHCGTCVRCLERKEGFMQSGVQDKTRYHAPT